jgi:mannan endo-1,4-beta-mannosidase
MIATHHADELCDVKRVTGQYPGVIGMDLGSLTDSRLHTATYLIQQAYARGLVATVSWHSENPVTGGSFNVADDHHDVTHTIRRLLPGGPNHHALTSRLDKIGAWANSLTDHNGHRIPVIFRPFHEMSENWFWWGMNNRAQNSAHEYMELFRFTVRYLRDTKHVHNVLYAYSPGKADSESDFMQTYPGDDFVDIIGEDFYYSSHTTSSQRFVDAILITVKLADEHDKIAAVTEIGYQGNGINSHHNFWMDHVLQPTKSHPSARRLAYMLTWHNTYQVSGSPVVWVPYKGHAAQAQFVNFFHDPVTVFSNDVRHMYTD